MNNIHPIAQAVQSQGRGKDTQLVHMTPGEVQGLHALAKAHGGSLSVNPETGLVEAGFLDAILPTIAGAGLMMVPGMQPIGAAMITGLGATMLNGGDLGKGLMAGLGAYGGAGLAGSLGVGAAAPGTGLTAAAPVGNSATAGYNAGANAAGSGAVLPSTGYGFGSNAAPALTANPASVGMQLPAVAPTTAMPTANQFALSTKPTMMDKLSSGSFYGDNAMNIGAAAAPMLLQEPKTQTAPVDNEQFQYTYNPGRASQEDLDAQRSANPGGELNYFNPTYGPRQTVRVAQGGLLGLAEGGMPFEYTYDPATQKYIKKPGAAAPMAAPMGAVTPIGLDSSGGYESTMSSPSTYGGPGLMSMALGNFGQAPAPVDSTHQTMSAPAAQQAQQAASIASSGGSRSIASPSGGGGNGHDAGVTGGNSFGGDNADGGGYNEAAGGLISLAGGGTIDLSGTVNLGGQGQQGALGGARPNNSFTGSPMGDLGGILGLFGGQQTDGSGHGGGGLSNYGNDTRGPMARDFDFGNSRMEMDYGSPAAHVLGIPPGSHSYQGPMTEAQKQNSTYAAGGMAKGGFVVPADVVSALGNGSTDAGLRALKVKLGSVKPIRGKGDGLSDSIPTSIDGRQPARVADGEAYIDPKVVAKIGGGDSKKGAQKLYAMMDKIRSQAHGKTTQQRKVDPRKVV
jgi:hypothetical protein